MKSYLKKLIVSIFGIEFIGVFNRWRSYRKNYKNNRFSRANIDKKLESLLPHSNGFYVCAFPVLHCSNYDFVL